MEKIFSKTQQTIAAVQSKDPRIDSPQIKVVYPTEVSTAKDAATTRQTETPQAVPMYTQAPTTPQPVVKSTTAETTSTPAVSATVPPTWMDTIKKNSTLFIVIALIAMGIGFFIGKKQ